jgi:hypothetical protein
MSGCDAGAGPNESVGQLGPTRPLSRHRSPGYLKPLEGHEKVALSGFKSSLENAVLEEGHGFSRAVNDAAIPGFSL